MIENNIDSILSINGFTEETKKQLKYYVYKLIDPRDGKVFYIGKGHGDRIFEHVRLVKSKQMSKQEKESDKIKLIQDIHNNGLEVIAIIHRHGMDEKIALEVEAALIDEYKYLTNKVLGHGSNEYGPLNVVEANNKYSMPTLSENDIDKEDKLLLIKITDKVLNDRYNNIYETVRSAWKIGTDRNEVKQVAAVKDGVILKVYKVEKWNYVEKRNRYEFEGHEIVNSKYINHRIPDKYRIKGNANPFLYTFK